MSLPPLFIDIPRNPVFAVGLPLAASFATGLITKNASYGPRSMWYKSLTKPTYNPPEWTFGIVWPALYCSMGYAAHLTVKTLDRTPPGFGRQKAHLAMKLYYAQLALNLTWTPLSFAAGNLGAALVNITALTGTVAWWFNTLQDVNVEASYFVLPYLGWSVYATYLNSSLWWNNGGKAQVDKLTRKAQK